jgi:hypothetical protein
MDSCKSGEGLVQVLTLVGGGPVPLLLLLLQACFDSWW